MSEEVGALACLECGQPVRDSAGWLCSARCAAVMRLVRYGRAHAESAGGDGLLDDTVLNRYRREAGVVGRFPTARALLTLGRMSAHRCQSPGCTEREAPFADWRSPDPALNRATRADDLLALCQRHHAEAVQRFIGPLGQTARSAPALWARMTAAEPLVLRDDGALWQSQRNLGLLRNWPLADAETREDVERWWAALREGAQPEGESGARVGAAEGPVGEPVEDALNRALRSLSLPPRRQARLARAIEAQLLRIRADEAVLDALARRVEAEAEDPPTGDGP